MKQASPETLFTIQFLFRSVHSSSALLIRSLVNNKLFHKLIYHDRSTLLRISWSTVQLSCTMTNCHVHLPPPPSPSPSLPLPLPSRRK